MVGIHIPESDRVMGPHSERASDADENATKHRIRMSHLLSRFIRHSSNGALGIQNGVRKIGGYMTLEFY